MRRCEDRRSPSKDPGLSRGGSSLPRAIGSTALTTYLVLDANIIMADWSLAGAAFRALENSLFSADFKVVVPEVVVAEAVNGYKEQVAEVASALTKVVAAARRLS